MAQTIEADADPVINLGAGEIKAETIVNSASTLSEAQEPDIGLTVAQSDTVTVARKETAVGDSILFLNKAEIIVASHTAMFPEFKSWQEESKQILGDIKRPRVLVGVLGYTGSGKSSLINALIDEEMVVPANSMRASTSVVTEISWNDSNDPEKAFRADIEFISEGEWRAEMDVLLDDLANATKGEDVSVKSGSEASTAFAKISAVWPGVTLAKLKGMTSAELFQQIDGVSNILDCNLDIWDSKAKSFSQQINSYIDSTNKQASSKGISYWPLVRCVRIYTKAEILRHGLVLVDLPGLGDSNTGRTQVAETYTKNLTYVWIVADIVRAIDDQVAKDLMGKSFRRQLLMDGKYDDKYVTFIMTKTDIINNEEVIESLHLRENELKGILAREEEILKEIHDGEEALVRKSVKAKKIKKALKIQMEKSSKGGKALSNKRKHIEGDRAEKEERSSSTLESMDNKITEKNLLVKKKAKAIKTIKATEKKLAELRLTLKLTRNDIKAACTQARNKYTQEHLKLDFENGLRELKQDISDDLNADRQPGNEDKAESKHLVHQRFHTEGLIDQLHVFCVSSKGYQKLAGRFKRDPMPKGFGTINETFIPGLQEYAAASTLDVRTKIADDFLNEFSLLKLSIKSWAENDSPNSLSLSQKHKLNSMLEEQLEVLHKAFCCAFENTMMRIREIIKRDILPTLQGCIRTGTEKAEQACRDLMDADTSYQTWKAICRRFGKFNTKKNVNYDWNGVFLEPFLGHLAKPWDKVFNSHMQAIHDEYSSNIVTAINTFSADIKPLLQNMSEASSSKSPIDFLEKVPYLKRKAKTAVSASLFSAQSQAQEIHRLIEPLIQHHLRPAYELCIQESKAGALNRMKEKLFEHISRSNQVMYKESSRKLKSGLKAMTLNLEGLLITVHTDTSDYLRKEIGDMIMLAVAKNDQTRKEARDTLRQDLTLELNILEAAWVRGASEPADKLLPAKVDGKPENDSSEEDSEDDDDDDDDVSDDSNSSDGAESISDDVEDS
ncbi:hypothetical protein NHQ30_008389 [Ciborinia camelliae]|nr:hypothetical protein NHQ30_008389 [Ciborinia camelliae]